MYDKVSNTCEFLHSSKSPYPPQFYSLPYKMNEVKIFLAHLLKGLPVNLTQKNNMKFKLIYSTAQRYLVQVALKNEIIEVSTTIH